MSNTKVTTNHFSIKSSKEDYFQWCLKFEHVIPLVIDDGEQGKPNEHIIESHTTPNAYKGSDHIGEQDVPDDYFWVGLAINHLKSEKIELRDQKTGRVVKTYYKSGI